MLRGLIVLFLVIATKVKNKPFHKFIVKQILKASLSKWDSKIKIDGWMPKMALVAEMEVAGFFNTGPHTDYITVIYIKCKCALNWCAFSSWLEYFHTLRCQFCHFLNTNVYCCYALLLVLHLKMQALLAIQSICIEYWYNVVIVCSLSSSQRILFSFDDLLSSEDKEKIV